MLKSKIQGAVITKTELEYKGSIGIPSEIMKKADILDGEQVHVLNKVNGERFITYAIEEESDTYCLYGPAAKKGKVGDEIFILSYAILDSKEDKIFKPHIIIVNPSK